MFFWSRRNRLLKPLKVRESNETHQSRSESRRRFRLRPKTSSSLQGPQRNERNAELWTSTINSTNASLVISLFWFVISQLEVLLEDVFSSIFFDFHILFTELSGAAAALRVLKIQRRGSPRILDHALGSRMAQARNENEWNALKVFFLFRFQRFNMKTNWNHSFFYMAWSYSWKTKELPSDIFWSQAHETPGEGQRGYSKAALVRAKWGQRRFVELAKSIRCLDSKESLILTSASWNFFKLENSMLLWRSGPRSSYGTWVRLPFDDWPCFGALTLVPKHFSLTQQSSYFYQFMLHVLHLNVLRFRCFLRDFFFELGALLKWMPWSRWEVGLLLRWLLRGEAEGLDSKSSKEARSSFSIFFLAFSFSPL